MFRSFDESENRAVAAYGQVFIYVFVALFVYAVLNLFTSLIISAHEESKVRLREKWRKGDKVIPNIRGECNRKLLNAMHICFLIIIFSLHKHINRATVDEVRRFVYSGQLTERGGALCDILKVHK